MRNCCYVLPDGSLLFTEEANNRIDRVQYRGLAKGDLRSGIVAAAVGINSRSELSESTVLPTRFTKLSQFRWNQKSQTSFICNLVYD
ncbi:MAG: hypothetical protein WBL95_15450 [Microcoleus sp.]